jgi:hypothetical protein
MAAPRISASKLCHSRNNVWECTARCPCPSSRMRYAAEQGLIANMQTCIQEGAEKFDWVFSCAVSVLQHKAADFLLQYQRDQIELWNWPQIEERIVDISDSRDRAKILAMIARHRGHFSDPALLFDHWSGLFTLNHLFETNDFDWTMLPLVAGADDYNLRLREHYSHVSKALQLVLKKPIPAEPVRRLVWQILVGKMQL